MPEDEILTGNLLEDACLNVEELAGAASVSRDWLMSRIEEGLIAVSGTEASEWRFSVVTLRRVQRMHAIERAFDAVPELSALVADMLEEMDALREQLLRARRR